MTDGPILLRAAACAVLTLLAALALGPRMIAWLGARFREPMTVR